MGKRKKKNGKAKNEQEPKYTLEDLMTRIEEYVENFEFDMAERFCEKALEMAADNVKVLETYGNVCAEVGDAEKAKGFFLKAVELLPENGHVKYLYLGQLCEGTEAVKYYEKAVDVMKPQIEFAKNNATVDEKLSDEDLSSVYVSLAEIFMTDCCMEENAEAECEKYCEAAMAANENNLDALITSCNLRLSQDNMDGAREFVEKALALWSAVSLSETESIADMLNYESRVTLVKLLIELDRLDDVEGIASQLVEENEDDARLWYYTGLAKHLCEPRVDNPRFYLEKAILVMEKAGCVDEDIQAHINKMLADCPPEEDEPEDKNEEQEQMETEE